MTATVSAQPAPFVEVSMGLASLVAQSGCANAAQAAFHVEHNYNTITVEFGFRPRPDEVEKVAEVTVTLRDFLAARRGLPEFSIVVRLIGSRYDLQQAVVAQAHIGRAIAFAEAVQAAYDATR